MSDLDKTPDQEVRDDSPAMDAPPTTPMEPNVSATLTEQAAPAQIEAHLPAVSRTEAELSPSAASPDDRAPQPALATPEKRPEGPTFVMQMDDAEVERRIGRMSRRSFLTGALGIAAGYVGWQWLIRQYPDKGTPWPFRRALEINEGLARGYFQDGRLSPTFPRAQATEPRANGDLGLPDEFDPATWKLKVVGLADTSATLTLDAIKALPRFEMVTELKCIEGWSTVVQWAGARFADFMAKYPPLKDEQGHPPQYVALETPDGGYYVGLDMASAIHPQTLLCYEMNGAPLTAEHGAPLRLAIPVKYGIKNIKRIGTIRYTNDRPKDYWAEQGYDWYSGH